jgi:hypothetical protein
MNTPPVARTWLNMNAPEPKPATTKPVTSPFDSGTARAGNRRFGRLSALCAHTKAP